MSERESLLIETRGGSELEVLRRELSLYRRIFDSARLVVGHEFSKPLTAATGYLELLEERMAGSLGDKEKGYIDKIAQALGRMSELVETFIEMLRVENRDADLFTMERFNVHTLLSQLKNRFIDHSDRLMVDVRGEARAVIGNRRCIEIVLDNLVSNALEHSGGSSVSVESSLQYGSERDDERAFLVFAVKDNGEGIPKEKLEEIFTPFFRLNRERSGLGLGLALVGSILKVIAGEISIESEIGKGTTFSVLLPVLASAVQSDARRGAA